MDYETWDRIGRIPVVLFFYVLVKATDTPETPAICTTALALVAVQFAAIGRCLYLGKPEASK